MKTTGCWEGGATRPWVQIPPPPLNRLAMARRRCMVAVVKKRTMWRAIVLVFAVGVALSGSALALALTSAHTGTVVKLEVGLSCGGVVSDSISITNPTTTKPVIYVAQFKPHPFCGTNSQYLVDPATGKRLPDGLVIFPPNTTAVADQYTCAQHPELDGCAGQGPSSQLFVFGITVTRGSAPTSTARTTTPTTRSRTTTTPTTQQRTTTTPAKKKCRCVSLTVKLDPTLLNKKGLPPDQHAFGVGLKWVMRCTAGTSGCSSTVFFEPPRIFAGTGGPAVNNIHLAIRKLTFLCKGPCGAPSFGAFQIKMLSPGQLKLLYGHTVAYRIKTVCRNIATVTTVRVFIDQLGVLRAPR